MKRHDEEGLTTADLAATPPRTDVEAERRRYAPPDDRDTKERPSKAPSRSDAEADRRRFERPEPRPDGDEIQPLFAEGEMKEMRSRWGSIQTDFVDEPRRSVEAADGLVASTIKRLAESFAEERSKLEAQWAKGGDVSTEDLRLAFRRYRSFFDRLLSV